MYKLPAIEIKGLSKRRGNHVVLAPVDLIVPRGSIFALIGHNGAGKSTLIKLLLNILRPTEGSATVLNIPSTRLHGDVFTRIGYVSENQTMPEWMTIHSLMAHLSPMYPAWSDDGLLEDLQLPPHRKIKELSRGMRMKVALASVLAFQPELLLMDEPFSGLDTSIRADFIKTLLDRTHADMEAENATTILISSHDLEEMESFATHVAFLHAGRLLFADSMENLLERYREVTATFDGSASDALSRIPDGCIAAEVSGQILRFVDTSVQGNDHESEIRRWIPEALHIESQRMNLRSIFLALNHANTSEMRKSR